MLPVDEPRPNPISAVMHLDAEPANWARVAFVIHACCASWTTSRLRLVANWILHLILPKSALAE